MFAALTGADSGGSWSGPVNGIYTYTIAASGTCPEDSATVTVKEDNANGCTSLQSEFQDFVDSVLFNLQPENASSFLNDQTAVTSVIQELQYYYANRSEIVDEYYDFLADLCGVYPQFFNINQTFDDVQFKYLGSFREQVHIYLRDYLRYYPDKEPQFISALDLSNGNAAKYFDIWNDFGILVIDNYSLDQTQLDVLYNLLTTIPTGSTNLGVIMFREFYTNDYVNALYITQSVSFINSFGLRVGSSPDYGFPADFDSFTSDTFSIALSHEICHTIDADYIGTNTRLNTWKNNLLSAAGTRYSEFLRTRVLDVGGNDFFQVYPQEFFASLANVFFSNSQLTLNLAIQRFNEGYKQPINQFLLMADALSVETNQTQFYVIDEVSNIDLTYYDIERNGNGFISKIFLNTQCLEFVYDENNFVIEINDGGCAITFPYNAFILYTETPACPNVEDGLIELSASSNTQGFVFDVQLTGNGRNETYTDALSFSSNVSIVDLASGTYTLSISLDEGYNIVYDEVVIGEPADLSAKRQRVDKTSSMAYYNVSGSESYTVTVNNLTHQYQVGSKGDHSLAVPISKSVNTITIKGAECQSVYQDLIS
ncbi:hypothetical protein, partial [uncultured Eudoraea sp.]|uniref:hypothetical protein n=1 Tax=uncultured Eudoraea sp. TaxID=1035614 RepID=UPI00262F2E60